MQMNNDETGFCLNVRSGIIYKLIGNGCIYIGSTEQPLLSTRLDWHRIGWANHRAGKSDGRLSSYVCFDGDEPPTIHELQIVRFDNLDLLLQKETEWIARIPECVNKIRHPIQSHDQRLLHKREYRKRHVEKLADAGKPDPRNLAHVCNCGGHYTLKNKVAHFKSKKHIGFLSNLAT